MRRLGLLIVLGLLPAAHAGDLKRLGPDPTAGVSRAVIVGESESVLYTAQVAPSEGAGTDARAQARDALERLFALLGESAGREDVVRLHAQVDTQASAGALRAEVARAFGKAGPALTVVVGELPDARWRLTLDAVARARKPWGEGRLAVRDGRLALLRPGPVAYVSGHAVKGATLTEATRNTLKELDGTLAFLGVGRDEVASVKCFLEPVADADAVRAEVRAWFGKRPAPPLVLVEWLAKGSVEIELVVAVPPSPRKLTVPVEYLTPAGLTASPVFSRVAVIHAGDRIYTSGLGGPGAGEAEVRATLDGLKVLLAEAGGDLRHLAKATYYVATDEASKHLNLLRPKYYDPKRPPAASKAPVRGVGREGAGLVLDMIGVVVPR